MNEHFTIVDKCVLLIGKRGSGKSVLLKSMLSYYGKTFSKIYVCSGTEEVNKFYSKSGIIPENCIYESYSEEFGTQLIDGLKKANSGLELSAKKKCLLILDDCIADTNFHQSKTLKNIFANGRHYSLSLLVTTQHLHSVSPLQRANFDFLFIGQQNSESVEVLCKTYRSGSISKYNFIHLYDDNTLDFNFFAINCNSVKNRDINQLYGVIKAPAERYKMVKEIIQEEKVIMKPDPSWDAMFSDKMIKQKIVVNKTIQKKVLIREKPHIRNVA
jgi:ABC-type dipeptide/oligopeptide/nickel transport system ATPase component